MTNSQKPSTSRGPSLVVAAVTLVGAVLIPVVALPALWQMSIGYGTVFTVLAAIQIGSLTTVLLRPTRRAVVFAVAGSTGLLLAWVLSGPGPWEMTDTAFGLTDRVFAGLQFLGWALLLIRVLRGGRPARLVGWVAGGLALLVVVPVSALSTTVAINGGIPASSVAYCRPGGVPLGMDIYPPAHRTARPAPIAVYIHGGGFLLGDRAPDGIGALLANSAGALFDPLQQRLNAQGYVVASIDYRLAPAAAWPAPISDAACAIRYITAHAWALGVDPHRIAVWGSSAGGTIASLLGTSNSVNAVVDMFGPADLNDFANASTLARTTLRLSLGTDPAVLRAASPRNHLRAGASPFLILHGTDDPLIGQSAAFADELRAHGDTATFLAVHGTGHQLDTPGQQPSVDQLVATITAFLDRALSWTPQALDVTHR